MLVSSPLHIVSAAGVANTVGVGSTIASTSKVGPSQPAPLLGVILYVTVCCTFVGLINGWAIVEPLPELAPVTPPVLLCTTQVYVVPTTPLVVLMAMFVVPPLQMVSSLAVASGNGLTVTTTTVLLLQLPAVAVIV